MAPTRRRRSQDSSPGRIEPELEHSPKTRRLSNGSRASSTSGSTSTGSPGTDKDDEPEEEEEEEAAPAAPKGKGKRRAIPGAVDNGNGDDNEEEEEEEDEEDPVALARKEAAEVAEKIRRTQEMCRQEEEERPLGADGGEQPGRGRRGAAGAGDEEDPQPKRKRGKKGTRMLSDDSETPHQAGIVLKINVSNFMCHRKLTVPLCKQVNFINGRNGSGKSAILAALQICLGAKANLTHRAKKMSDFIRHGWDGDAILEVTLLNNDQGFKHELYGDSITIRRTIRRPSGGGFSLISHDGTVVSKDRVELIRMLDILNIQVDNPCAVLDQENSKKFLQGSDSDKYAFFMKATDLDRILSDNEATGRSISMMKSGHHEAVNLLPRYEEIFKSKRAELKEYQDLEDLANKIVRLNEKLVWAVVGEAEEIVTDANDDVKLKTDLIGRINDAIARWEEKIARISAGKEEVKERYDAGVAEIQRLKKEVIEKGKELADAQAPLLQFRTELTSLEAERRAKMNAKESISRKLKMAREMAKRKASDQKEKRLHELMQKTEEGLANVSRMRTAMGDGEKLFRLRKVLNDATDGAERAKEDFQRCSNEHAALKAELRSLETESFNPLTAIAPFMPALVKRIAQEGRKFQSPPVGPIGASIQLKEDCKQYRVCIEGHLSNNLSNFVVSCQQDKTKLMALMKQFRGNQRWYLPTVIVQSPQPRYRPPENPAGYLQMMQAINVTDDQAFNSLVDQCSIEKNCLFASKAEAEARCLLGASGRYERMPHGMFEAYYPSMGGKSCSKFNVSDGNLQTRMNTVNVRRHKSVLGVDEGTQKQEVMQQVQQAVTALHQVRLVADAEARKANAAEEHVLQEQSRREELEKQKRQLEQEKNRLSTELMALQAKKNGSTDPTEELERELELASEELETVAGELATLADVIREKTAQVEPFRKSKEDAKRAHKAATDATERIREEFENGGAQENKYIHQVNKAQAILAKETLALDKASEEAEDAKLNLASELENATIFMKIKRGDEWDGSRVEVRHTADQLRHQVKQKTLRYEKDRQRRGIKSKSRAEVEEQLSNAYSNLQEKHTLCQQLDLNMKMLAQERKERTRKWKEMKNFVERQTSRLFDQYLQDKGASGEVLFDDENQTLGLTYQKDSNDDSIRCNDVKLLSGGERSVTTLALLLALGTGVECPFRVMDEFDVYMDAMSRNIAIGQVVAFARLDKSRQFILITPQDLSSVTPSDTCKIIKLEAPRKGDHTQRTLEESFGAGAS